jgi:hypothetical protein
VAVPDRHREEIATALRERGLVVRTDVGLSEFRIDLSVAPADAPGTPVMAVLLDGPAWARRRTVGDRDGLPVEVLSGMLRWPAVERVWLPTWLQDRTAVLDRLVAAVDAIAPPPQPTSEPAPQSAFVATLAADEPAFVATLAADGGAGMAIPAPAVEPVGEVKAVAPLRTTVPTVVEPVAAEPEPVAVPEQEPVAATPKPVRRAPRKAPATPLLDGEAPFVPWAPKPTGDRKALDSLADARVARTVRRVLLAGVKAEGPVHRDRLTRLTAGAFGLSRVTETRRDALLALLPPSTLDGEFVWPEGTDRGGWVQFRRQAAGTDRPLEHVAPVEVGNAMGALCRAAAGMTQDELFLRTAEVFGYRRRTPSLLPLLQSALDLALHTGRVTRQESGLLTPA